MNSPVNPVNRSRSMAYKLHNRSLGSASSLHARDAGHAGRVETKVPEAIFLKELVPPQSGQGAAFRFDPSVLESVVSQLLEQRNEGGVQGGGVKFITLGLEADGHIFKAHIIMDIEPRLGDPAALVQRDLEAGFEEVDAFLTVSWMFCFAIDRVADRLYVVVGEFGFWFGGFLGKPELDAGVGRAIAARDGFAHDQSKGPQFEHDAVVGDFGSPEKFVGFPPSQVFVAGLSRQEARRPNLPGLKENVQVLPGQKAAAEGGLHGISSNQEGVNPFPPAFVRPECGSASILLCTDVVAVGHDLEAMLRVVGAPASWVSFPLSGGEVLRLDPPERRVVSLIVGGHVPQCALLPKLRQTFLNKREPSRTPKTASVVPGVRIPLSPPPYLLGFCVVCALSVPFMCHSGSGVASILRGFSRWFLGGFTRLRRASLFCWLGAGLPLDSKIFASGQLVVWGLGFEGRWVLRCPPGRGSGGCGAGHWGMGVVTGNGVLSLFFCVGNRGLDDSTVGVIRVDFLVEYHTGRIRFTMRLEVFKSGFGSIPPRFFAPVFDGGERVPCLLAAGINSMKTRYRFWANGIAGGIKVKAEGVVLVAGGAAGEWAAVGAAAEAALGAVQKLFPGFVQKGTGNGVTVFPKVRRVVV